MRGALQRGNLSIFNPLESLLKTISILGSGWLGLPLAEHFIQQGYAVKASTRSIERSRDIEAIGAKFFVVDIDQPLAETSEFLDSDILLVNITSKNIEGFHRLINKLEKALVRKVIYVVLLRFTKIPIQ